MALAQAGGATMTETIWVEDVLQRLSVERVSPSALVGQGMTWVHQWFSEAVQPGIAALVRAAGEDDCPQLALAKVHLDAANGAAFTQTAWMLVLEPAFLQMFRLSYPYDEAHAIAHASASDFAAANREMIDEAFGSGERYAQYYADLNTGRNQEFASDAQAAVHAQAVANALAAESAAQFAASWPHIRLRAMLAVFEKLYPFAPELSDVVQRLSASIAECAGVKNSEGETAMTGKAT